MANETQVVQHFDNWTIWHSAVKVAASLGVIHAQLGTPMLSEKKLVEYVANRIGRFGYRHFHGSALRRIYGSAFLGVSRVQEAKAKGF